MLLSAPQAHSLSEVFPFLFFWVTHKTSQMPNDNIQCYCKGKHFCFLYLVFGSFLPRSLKALEKLTHDLYQSRNLYYKLETTRMVYIKQKPFSWMYDTVIDYLLTIFYRKKFWFDTPFIPHLPENRQFSEGWTRTRMCLKGSQRTSSRKYEFMIIGNVCFPVLYSIGSYVTKSQRHKNRYP
jgi:hypothetical protein